ncbi:hypothetical protein CB1_000166003 [Camelus ferus]|nr:hypothetical protein CB1_000166003 [Camelus ferus]
MIQHLEITMENKNNVTEFVLLGLTQNPEMQKVLFVPFLLIYLVTIAGNLLIMSCMTQVFIDHLFAGAEVILLVVMAYDRYVAICKPLHYLIIMNRRWLHDTAFAEHFLEASEIVLVVMAYDRYLAICRPLHYVIIMNHHTCCLLVGVVLSPCGFKEEFKIKDEWSSWGPGHAVMSDKCIEENHLLGLEHFLGGSEIIILVVMAYDHYMAICKPLQYMTIMQQWLCQFLVVVAWLGGILHATVQFVFAFDLTFCGPNVIDHFMCDFFSLLKLSCSDTYRPGVVVAANSGGMCLLIFFTLLISYIVVLSSLRSRGAEGRRKALSTCPMSLTTSGVISSHC